MVVRNPDHYAIVIGIDGYTQLRRLREAGDDATRFASWLTCEHGGGLDPKNVKLILSPPQFPADPLDALPIQREVTRALRDIGVERQARIGQRLYFYFAGHGFGPVFNDVGLLFADAAMGRLGSNLGIQRHREHFHGWGLFDEVIYILDCCRDPFSERDVETRGPDFNKPKTGNGVAPPRVNDFVVMAASYGEKAFQIMDQEVGERRGVLTKAVLEGLRGEAADTRGRVTGMTLGKYVKARVPKVAIDPKERQVPEVFPGQEEIVLAVVPLDRLPRVTVRIVAPRGLTGTLVIRDMTDRSVVDQRDAATVTADRPPWELELVRTGTYLAEHPESGTKVLLDPNDIRNPFPFPRPQ